MNTIVKSLKALTTKLGGTDTTSKTVVDALKKVFGAYGGTGSTAKTISGCIDEITTVATPTPTGKLTITGTSEVNCSSYATAQVSDADLVAENIKKDVNILGVTGSYEGGGGSNDFSTAEVYYLNKKTTFTAYFPTAYYDEYQGEVTAFSNSVQTISGGNAHDTYQVILYKGECLADFTSATGSISITGDATNNDGYIHITGDCTITIN